MCVCMECISTCVNSARLWEHQNSLDQSDMRYIEQVPSDIRYWVVLSTSNRVNHIDRLNYISRDIFLPSSKGHLQSRHIHCLLKVSSSGAGCIGVLHRAWRKEGRMLLGAGNVEKMWSAQLCLGVLTILTMALCVPSTHGDPFLLQGKLEYRLHDTGTWLSFCFAACHGQCNNHFSGKEIKMNLGLYWAMC